MAAPLDIACPFCSKPFKVPAELAGKLIRCKDCQQMFEVPAAMAPKPARPVAAKPTAAKPVAAKPTAAKAAEPPADMPFKFKEEPAPPPPPKPNYDDDDNPNPYGLVNDDSHIPRCPHCAKELDPPDTQICLNCGYDLIGRKQHESKKVYAHSPGDWFAHLGPAFGCILLIIVLLALDIIVWLNLRSWMTDSILDASEKDKITGDAVFYVRPLCFNLWIGVMSAWVIWMAGKFAFVRLVFNWMPPETLKR